MTTKLPNEKEAQEGGATNVEATEREPFSIRDAIKESAEQLQQNSDNANEPEGQAVRAPRDQSTEETNPPRDQSTEKESAITPPRYWSDDKKHTFSTLPREMQEFLVERESQTERFIGTQSQERSKLEKQVREMTESIPKETREALRAQGVEDQDYIKRLIKIDQFAQRDPLGAVLWILNTNGETLEGLHNRARAEADIPEHVRKVYNERTQLEEEKLRANEELETLRLQTFTNQIEVFAEEKNLQGERVRPYMEDPQVQQEVSRLIPLLWEQAPRATSQQVLEEAYRRATSYLPHISEAETRKLEQLKKEEDKKAVEKARRAASSLTSSSGVSAAMYAKPTNMKDAIRLSLQQIKEGRI